MAYTLIGTSTSGGSSVIFNNIPQIYKDLHIFISGQGAEAGTSTAVYLAFNDDTTSSNYRGYGMYADNTSIVSGYWNNRDFAYLPAITTGADRNGQADIYIPKYSLTDRKKLSQCLSTTAMANNDSTNGRFTVFITQRWNSTAAISKITVTSTSGSFTSKTKIHLFGIS